VLESNQSIPLNPYDHGTFFDSISIILSSYGFILNFFPIYSQLTEPNNKKGLLSITMALIFCAIIYLYFSFLCLKQYGDSIQPSIFDNLSAEGPSIPGAIIFTIFVSMFLCNAPFAFNPAKEALLGFYDEMMNRTLSKDLEKKQKFNPVMTAISNNK
jgi:amino acid permease